MSADKIDRPAASSASDWARRPASLAVWWVVPIAIGMATEPLALSQPAAAFVWAAMLAWMGLGCLLNARRCRRRHCYFSGPVLVAGAAVAALIGWGAISLGPGGLNLTLWATLGLALLSFLPELVWGKYVRR